MEDSGASTGCSTTSAKTATHGHSAWDAVGSPAATASTTAPPTPSASPFLPDGQPYAAANTTAPSLTPTAVLLTTTPCTTPYPPTKQASTQHLTTHTTITSKGFTAPILSTSPVSTTTALPSCAISILSNIHCNSTSASSAPTAGTTLASAKEDVTPAWNTLTPSASVTTIPTSNTSSTTNSPTNGSATSSPAHTSTTCGLTKAEPLLPTNWQDWTVLQRRQKSGTARPQISLRPLSGKVDSIPSMACPTDMPSCIPPITKEPWYSTS